MEEKDLNQKEIKSVEESTTQDGMKYQFIYSHKEKKNLKASKNNLSLDGSEFYAKSYKNLFYNSVELKRENLIVKNQTKITEKKLKKWKKIKSLISENQHGDQNPFKKLNQATSIPSINFETVSKENPNEMIENNQPEIHTKEEGKEKKEISPTKKNCEIDSIDEKQMLKETTLEDLFNSQSEIEEVLNIKNLKTSKENEKQENITKDKFSNSFDAMPSKKGLSVISNRKKIFVDKGKNTSVPNLSINNFQKLNIFGPLLKKDSISITQIASEIIKNRNKEKEINKKKKKHVIKRLVESTEMDSGKIKASLIYTTGNFKSVGFGTSRMDSVQKKKQNISEKKKQSYESLNCIQNYSGPLFLLDTLNEDNLKSVKKKSFSRKSNNEKPVSTDEFVLVKSISPSISSISLSKNAILCKTDSGEVFMGVRSINTLTPECKIYIFINHICLFYCFYFFQF